MSQLLCSPASLSFYWPHADLNGQGRSLNVYTEKGGAKHGIRTHRQSVAYILSEPANRRWARLGMLALASSAVAQATGADKASLIQGFTSRAGLGDAADLSAVRTQLALLPLNFVQGMASRPKLKIIVCKNNITDCDPQNRYSNTTRNPYGAGLNATQYTSQFLAPEEIIFIAASTSGGTNLVLTNRTRSTSSPLLMAGFYVEAFFGAPYPSPGLASQANYTDAYRVDFPSTSSRYLFGGDPATDKENYANYLGLAVSPGRNTSAAPRIFAYFDQFFATYIGNASSAQTSSSGAVSQPTQPPTSSIAQPSGSASVRSSAALGASRAAMAQASLLGVTLGMGVGTGLLAVWTLA